MKYFKSKISTPIGHMIAISSEKGLCLLEFEERKNLEKQIKALSISDEEVSDKPNPFLLELEIQLNDYFQKKRTNFDLPFDLVGTDFQKKVWNALLEVGFGETASYQTLTNKLGNPKTIRAVAAANGANKIAILVPCHRIIGSDGSLTGYAGGLWRKKWLLEHESKQIKIDF